MDMSNLSLEDSADQEAAVLEANSPDTKAAPKPNIVKDTDKKDEDFHQSLSDGNQRDLLYYSFFGRPGFFQSNKATFMSWRSNQFQNPRTERWEVALSTPHLLRLLHGFCPLEMEDNWFIYADGPHDSGMATVNFHHSWSGDKVAEISIEIHWGKDSSAEAWSGNIASLTIEKDFHDVPSGESAESFAKYLVLEACNRILGIKIVDEINEPVYWRETLSKKPISDLPTRTGMSFRGTASSCISAETREDIRRLGGMEGLIMF